MKCLINFAEEWIPVSVISAMKNSVLEMPDELGSMSSEGSLELFVRLRTGKIAGREQQRVNRTDSSGSGKCRVTARPNAASKKQDAQTRLEM